MCVFIFKEKTSITSRKGLLNLRKINVFHVFPIKEKETTQTFLQMQKRHLLKSHPLPSQTPSLQEKRTFNLVKGMCDEPIVTSNGNHWGFTPRSGAGEGVLRHFTPRSGAGEDVLRYHSCSVRYADSSQNNTPRGIKHTDSKEENTILRQGDLHDRRSQRVLKKIKVTRTKKYI